MTVNKSIKYIIFPITFISIVYLVFSVMTLSVLAQGDGTTYDDGILTPTTTATTDEPPVDASPCNSSFLGMSAWHKYLDKEIDMQTGDCEIIAPNGLLEDNIPWRIMAAVIEMMLTVATYIAVVMVFWGSYQILTSSGSPESVAGGRNKIVNGIIGFIIAIMAISVVSYITSELVITGDTIVYTDPVTQQTVNLLPDEDPDGLLSFALSIAYRVAAGLTVIFVAISGFNFTTSSGDPQRVAKARNSLIYALVGLVVALLAVGIITAVGGRI